MLALQQAISVADANLSGFGYGFGRAFAYAKQEAAFAAGVMYPREALPSASLAIHPTAGSPLKPPPGLARSVNIFVRCVIRHSGRVSRVRETAPGTLFRGLVGIIQKTPLSLACVTTPSSLVLNDLSQHLEHKIVEPPPGDGGQAVLLQLDPHRR